MTVASAFQFSHDLGIHWNQRFCKQFEIQGPMERGKLHSLSLNPSSYCRDSWRVHLSNRGYVPLNCVRYKCNVFKCHSSLVSGKSFRIFMKPSVTALTRSYDALQGCPLVVKIVPALGIIIFAVCGLGPLLRQVRKFLFHKSDSSWQKSGTYHVTISYLRPLMVWAGLILICREFDSLIPPSEAAEVVKLRLLNFVRSFSTVMAFAYCLSSVIQHAQKFFLETNDASDARKMGFHFAGKAVYSAVWVAAVSLFMELLGFSTQRWLTAGGLGTVLLTLAGREIFTNFLSSVMIHATRPFVLNEWIQTKIEGYEVSGTVEHVGWWSPTIIRGEDREAVHIPNHKFTMNVVRNLSQKTHWRIKTHLAVSHLDVSKINNIVADMRKVLAKNPQVEQQRLHRRVFLDRVHHENQALLVLISCFVKTSHFEEYLCVKETIILDLLRVMSHHRARLATPIRTVQKMYYDDMNMENIPFADTVITYGAAASPLNRPFLLGEPPHKINGGDKARSNNGGDPKPSKETVSDSSKGDAKSGAKSDSGKAPKVKLASKSQSEVEMPHSDGSFQKQSKQDVKMDEADTLKQETEKPHRSASMEENIVLGVALEGSKRTLPIEEEDV